MKTMNKTFAWMLAAVLSLSIVSQADAQTDAKERTGKVVRIKGNARYSSGNKVWQPLKVGTVIKSGNIVQTAMNSYVDIVVNEEASARPVAIDAKAVSATMRGEGGGSGGSGINLPVPDQDVVRILDDSYLVFDSLTATTVGEDTVTETLIDLKKGSIFGSVKKQAAASRFEVKTPHGVAGIRGTWFFINDLCNISCLAGSVLAAVTDAAGNVATYVINGGQTFTAANGSVEPIASDMAGFFNEVSSEVQSVANPPQTGRPDHSRDNRRGPPDHSSGNPSANVPVFGP